MRKMRSVLLIILIMCFSAAAVADTPVGMSEISVGRLFTFGTYEQDNHPDNGPEPIEWVVLDVCEGKALLLSKYGLDAIPFHTVWEDDPTWETCTLRTWLNEDFWNTAFSPEEQSAILLTDVDNSAEQGCSQWTKDGGNDTQDRIFLLSFAEANRYLGVIYKQPVSPYEKSIPSAQARATDYAIARGVMINGEHVIKEDRDAAGWWLRSPGHYEGFTSCVNVSGRLIAPSPGTNTIAVRPVFWLSLDTQSDFNQR